MPLSTKQMEYLALAWQCFETEPKIDYNKFYQVAGLASANSARELMRVTKNKLKSEYGALSGDVKAANANTPKKKNGDGSSAAASASCTPAPSTGKKRGRKPKAAAEDGAEDDAEESPTKKAKKAASGKVNGAVKAEPEEDGELGDDIFQ